MNTFGTLFTLTTAGESHGPALVGIVDGMPAGIRIDFERIKLEMSRRKPGQRLSSARREEDEVTFLSGFLDNVTLGTPIAFTITNKDSRPDDYEYLKKTFRPSHADFTYQTKYGIRDVRGGGRSSARETALRVVAGALAMQALEKRGIDILAFTCQIGNVSCGKHPDFEHISTSAIWDSPVRCPFPEYSDRMVDELEKVREKGDTVGCKIACVITGLPAGVGEPLYDKLSARLGYAMLGINAAHAFEYGLGTDFTAKRGSEVVDKFILTENGTIATETNHSGGIQGGISNGMPVTFSVTFKPLPSLMQPVESIDMRGEPVIIQPKGRHDVCAAPRAVPVVRAMAAIAIMDLLLQFDARRKYGSY